MKKSYLHVMTHGEYMKQIEDALQEQLKWASTLSKEEAEKITTALGIQHLLKPLRKKRNSPTPTLSDKTISQKKITPRKPASAQTRK